MYYKWAYNVFLPSFHFLVMDLYFPHFVLLYSSNGQNVSPDFDKTRKVKPVTLANCKITCHQNFKMYIPNVGGKKLF